MKRYTDEQIDVASLRGVDKRIWDLYRGGARFCVDRSDKMDKRAYWELLPTRPDFYDPKGWNEPGFCVGPCRIEKVRKNSAYKNAYNLYY